MFRLCTYCRNANPEFFFFLLTIPSSNLALHFIKFRKNGKQKSKNFKISKNYSTTESLISTKTLINCNLNIYCWCRDSTVDKSVWIIHLLIQVLTDCCLERVVINVYSLSIDGFICIIRLFRRIACKHDLGVRYQGYSS